MSWWALLALAAGAYACKALGVFGLGRLTSGPVEHVVAVLPAALFAALIVVQTVGSGSAEEIWTRVVGVTAGGIAHWCRAPLLVVIVVAAAVTAMMERLSRKPIPLALLSQFLPRQHDAVREGRIGGTPGELLREGVAGALRPYFAACAGGAA